MLGLLGWIPVLGPVIDGILSIFTKHEDTVVEKYKVDGSVDTQIIQSSTQLTLAMANDIAFRLARDLVMFPGALWCGLFVEGKIMDRMYPEYVWTVSALDGPLEYLPYALFTYFFGVTAMHIWRR